MPKWRAEVSFTEQVCPLRACLKREHEQTHASPPFCATCVPYFRSLCVSVCLCVCDRTQAYGCEQKTVISTNGFTHGRFRLQHRRGMTHLPGEGIDGGVGACVCTSHKYLSLCVTRWGHTYLCAAAIPPGANLSFGRKTGTERSHNTHIQIQPAT